ncbi:MAG: pseudouridine-5'-phosphate glycosidase [Gemmatimonadales bacterium]
MTAPYVCGDEIAAALARGRPVVALETTVVTHGLPHPDGVIAAQAIEEEIRQGGATPATIGILRGAIRVGLTNAELNELATTPDVVKVNLSNLAATVAAGRPGATTVAATMFAAHANGISVFVTGGIGGVHRNASVSGDVSADLTALSRIPIPVVCAGAKAILDLPRTVEMLETLGVPVFGLQTNEFPAFYRRSSGLSVDSRMDTIEELAAAVRAHFALGLGTGVLIANPIPAADELPTETYEQALETALSDAESQEVRGRRVTPFLLERLRALSEGGSVRANLALLMSNARVGAQLARALAQPGR